MSDISRMKISELIALAEQKAKDEKMSPPPPESVATWTDTLEILRTMKEGGIPDSLADDPA